MRRFLLQVWKQLPLWLQIVLSRVIRPLFQVGSAAVIFDDRSRILLVKSTYQRFNPWGMPGGSLEYGETAENAVLREVYEETGLTIEVERLLLVKTFAPDKFILYYLCIIKDGVFQSSDEVSEFGYFSLDNLPEIRLKDYAIFREIYELMGLREHELA